MPRLLCGLLLLLSSSFIWAAPEQLLVLDHQSVARDITRFFNLIEKPHAQGAPSVIAGANHLPREITLQPSQPEWFSVLVSNQSGKVRPVWLVPQHSSPLSLKVYYQSGDELILMEASEGFYYLELPAGYGYRILISMQSNSQQKIHFRMVDSRLLPQNLPKPDFEFLVYGLLLGMAVYGALFSTPSLMLRYALFVAMMLPLLTLATREQHLIFPWALPAVASQWLLLAIWSLIVVWICRVLGKPVALSKWLVRAGNFMLPIHLLVFSAFLVIDPRISWLFAALLLGAQFLWLSRVRSAYDMSGLPDPGPLHLSLLPVMLWCVSESLATFDNADRWMISAWWLNRTLVFLTVLLMGNAFFRRQQQLWLKQKQAHKSEKLTSREQGKQLAKVAKESLQSRKEAEVAKLEARTDALTHLLNRKALEEDLHLVRQVWQHDHTQDHLIMAIDLDGMKGVNDSLGHAEGDRMLQVFATSMQTMFRAEDRLYRTGGDEFVAILGIQNAKQARRRLDLALASTREQGYSQIGLSAGTALVSECMGNVEQALTIADNRMYQEKRSKPSHRSSIPQR
ncbi:GGDEF domain-containing protein [Pelagibaculum spongiae]|uniref:diguanylate cyclase n=1 Tax=Pelagibaculum spongiae TaxID=2080658 RepID=A0A2V1H243_9GAMM|nr:diguanylate cyclase [Pelagibaculum spongiae]PVZ70512.1 hypothetical protein DC094_07985 [Pelagibaculum spongiae]